MKYYKKDDVIFHQLDENSLTNIKIYKKSNIKKIIKITDNKIYNDTLQRDSINNFEVSSLEVFQDNFNCVENSI